MLSVAELRARLNVADDPETDAATDALLEALERHAVAQVELTTGGYFGPSAEFTDQVIGDGTTELRLPRAPVSDVFTVTESWLTDTTPTPIDVTDFVLRSPRLIRTGGGLWARDAEYEVIYQAGYLASERPPVMMQAVYDIVSTLYDEQLAAASADEEFKKETFGDYSYERFVASGVGAAALQDRVKTILAQLPRRLRV